jgi:hypothetical protein
MRSIHPLFERQKSILELSTMNKGGTQRLVQPISAVDKSMISRLPEIRGL